MEQGSAPFQLKLDVLSGILHCRWHVPACIDVEKRCPSGELLGSLSIGMYRLRNFRHRRVPGAVEEPGAYDAGCRVRAGEGIHPAWNRYECPSGGVEPGVAILLAAIGTRSRHVWQQPVKTQG